MSTRMYALPVEQTRWEVPGGSTTVFDWEYDEGRDRLLSLYEKGKQKQWDGAERLDWTIEVDLSNPMGIPDEAVSIFGSPIWDSMGEKDRAMVRHHLASWQFSQFLHGEQGALICSSKIVHTVPGLDAKFYAATQVMDEARHVEVYSRYLREKLDLAYPISPGLKSLLDEVISDSRWDMTYLGMQVLIEGLALAAFGLIRDIATEPLASTLNAYVMQDEARHVAFGRLALRDYYPELTQAERAEREEFCVEACYLMRQRFLGEEVWRNLDIDADECVEYMRNSEHFKLFQSHLFSRIVPTLGDIGLFGDRMRQAFADIGIIGYENADLDQMMEQDEKIADDLDRARIEQVEKAIIVGRTAGE
ncbi:ferritin-like domain-containing protein [Actinophytocola oryzae]|uniref:Ribonucleotide reductase beta subunit family protein with ferritin-like domain n=1 Tax=Actinophytocola oryzae TaxID=502181 RepID=A0A4R7W0X9_9PSEU|nr:ferritin-like domain-containing protein [Actinophytocola oryzae]TDV56186.1 ribonucleotide reductase beta subunit family protein with ferritin-like domain [Actinophytocola oryzae]